MNLFTILERVARSTLRAGGFESGFTPTSISPVHVYKALGKGSLPPVVIVHGFGSSAAPFTRVLRRLVPYVKAVYAVELPGHGFSPSLQGDTTPLRLAETVHEAIRTNVREPFVLVGNSLGGAICVRYVLAHPEHVRALVLGSPAGAPMNSEEQEHVFSSFRVKTAKDAQTFLSRLMHRPPWFGRVLTGALREQMERPAMTSFLQNVSDEDMFSPEQIRAVTVPTLLIWGRSDRLLPRSGFEFYRKHLPNAVVQEPEGIGHCPQIDAPDTFVQAIVSFAQQVTRTA